jgi:hypothetical protein
VSLRLRHSQRAGPALHHGGARSPDIGPFAVMLDGITSLFCF